MKMCELKTTRPYRRGEVSRIKKNLAAGRFAGAQHPVSYTCFMRLPLIFVSLLFCSASSFAAELALTDAQQQFRTELSARVAELEAKKASVFTGPDGWLFLASELRFLAQGQFWGDAAKPIRLKSADPVPAILDFQRQLKARGIELLLVPVPPKAAVYPEKFSAAGKVTTAGAPYLRQFYEALRGSGVEVLDLMPLFMQNREQPRGAVFCESDSHWSGVGCMLAAQAIAEAVRAKLPASPPRKEYVSEWKEMAISGDLAGLLASDARKVAPETIALRTIAEKGSGGAVQADANSPVLLMGDSHTLVFREFLAERAGLLDQMANELGFAPDLIGTRGSGATAVRISLYRKAKSDPNYLARKKVVVWCFAAREFTESEQGWVPQPVAK